jgi:hypothetical protein
MILWSIAIIATLVFLFFGILLLFRKVQFDAVHRNFLEFEDHFGGRIVRGGFANRPKFKGQFHGKNFEITFTSEKTKNDRRYYINISMEGSNTNTFSVMAMDWLDKEHLSEERKQNARLICNGLYFLESSNPEQVAKLNIAMLETQINNIAPFAWLLFNKGKIMLERISHNIIEDTKLETIEPLLHGLLRLQEAAG